MTSFFLAAVVFSVLSFLFISLSSTNVLYGVLVMTALYSAFRLRPGICVFEICGSGLICFNETR
jgi:uncharacterized membrane protein